MQGLGSRGHIFNDNKTIIHDISVIITISKIIDGLSGIKLRINIEIYKIQTKYNVNLKTSFFISLISIKWYIIQRKTCNQ